MEKNIRGYALEGIMEVLEDKHFCTQVLHDIFKENDFEARDRAFLSTLVEGTVERCIELDYVINQFSDKKVDKLKPAIRNIFRMSVYQMLYMDKVPDNAVVNEAVNLTIRRGFRGLKGFVNGVLRNIARQKDSLEKSEKLSVKYSIPEWIVDHFQKELGNEDTIRTFEYYSKPKSIVIRCTEHGFSKDNLEKKLKDKGIHVTPGNIFSNALRLKNPGPIQNIPGYQEGAFVVQDESSMIPAHIALQYFLEKEKIDVIDLCASPGGKILHLASNLSKDSVCIARDVSDKKVKRILENAKRLQIDNIDGQVADATIEDKSCFHKYDVVIADVPCSGLGVLSKKPDIKFNITENSMKQLQEIQSDILACAAKYTKPGGIVLYSTCTISRYENEDNVQKFLHQNSNYRVEPLLKYIPDSLRDAVTSQGYIKVIPGRMESDGFFVAMLKNEEE